ncbi:uncharacterized protein LOC141781256 isoform X2 [Sebastes fasciatus]|uniref:uncharacterized protein LOC141781256 isoform X2 n=2 Tax=Sebastes fasciatus TaxID=394691 RepID=UPI003D9EF531
MIGEAVNSSLLCERSLLSVLLSLHRNSTRKCCLLKQMMKMSGRVTSCCVALLFVLTSVSAVQRLRSINALKKINFGQSVPKHSLLLLHWFANAVDIDGNNIIWLTFDSNSGDYGSHQYHNSEELLDPLPWGNEYRYYTIGNLYQETSMPLPLYVVRPRRMYVGTNSDRIIIRVRGQNTRWRDLQRIDQVYITQHIEHQGEYDPDQTYRITTNLLREIREFSVGQNQQQLRYLRNLYGSNADDLQLRDIRNTWRDLACLGLLLFIVIQEKYSSNQQNRQNHLDDDASERESNVPRHSLNQGHVAVDFKDYKSQQDNTSVPQNNIKGWFCCCCCIAICFFILLYYTIISLY